MFLAIVADFFAVIATDLPARWLPFSPGYQASPAFSAASTRLKNLDRGPAGVSAASRPPVARFAHLLRHPRKLVIRFAKQAQRFAETPQLRLLAEGKLAVGAVQPSLAKSHRS